MIYQYKLVDDKYNDLLDSLTDNYLNINESSYWREKLKKVDQNNFFTLFYEFTYNKPIKSLTIIELECFFTLRSTTYFENERAFNETYATINFKNEISNSVNYLLNKKRYSEQALIYELLEIKENIIIDNLSMLNYIIVLFSDYCDLDESFEESKKIHFVLNIIDALEDHEDELNKLIDDIDIKINSLSTVKKGNYKIKVDDYTLLKIYKNLEKNDFIDIYKTSSKDFIEVFKLDFESHNSIIDFNMDKIQFNYFITLFEKHLKIKIPLTLIEYSGNMVTKASEIKANVIYSSVSRNKMGPKKQEILESIF